VAGRAGRGDIPGIVLIQTINPDHYAVRMAAAQDYGAFYEKEISFRRMMHYPPFSAMANVLIRAEKKEAAMRMSSELAQYLTPTPEQMRVIGPAEAPVPRLKRNIGTSSSSNRRAGRRSMSYYGVCRASRSSGSGAPPLW